MARFAAFNLLLVAVGPAFAADDGFVQMFNGKDLSGWVNVNCHPGTFFVKRDEIVTTGKPTGYMRTVKQYENFVLEMDWMHVNTKEVGNSGLFVWGDPLPAVGAGYTRGIEVQVLVNLERKDKDGRITVTSHGDMFSIWGAKCTPDRPHPSGWERNLPSENRAKGGGEWNHYKVTANDGVIKLEVNGKEVSGVSKCNPRKGYLALESEGAECHFKNLKIKELPSTNPKPEECAKVDEGHVSLFNGLDLAGWKTERGSWKAGDGILKPTDRTMMTSENVYTKSELLFDWKMPAMPTDECAANISGAGIVIYPGGTGQVAMAVIGNLAASERVTIKGLKPGTWNRTILGYDGPTVTATVNGQLVGTVKVEKASPAGPVILHPAEKLELRNLFVREIKAK